MNREYHKWFSPRLQREMELLVFGHAGARVLVFPARLGRFYDYENWGMVEALRDSIQRGCLQLFCVDSIDGESLYALDRPPADRIARHRQYEDYILHEVLPFTFLRNPEAFLIVHGCSFGAYHAVNIALRHPGRFGKVVAFSGRYDLTRSVGVFRDLFSGYYDQEVYFHTPNHFLPNLSDEDILKNLRGTEIALTIGQEDPFFESSQALSRALLDKSIGHRFNVWEGEAHKPRYWRSAVTSYL